MTNENSSRTRECQETCQLEGRYANVFTVGHNAFEFVLEFGQFYPEGEPAKVHTRIVTSPSYVKEFIETLQTSVKQYEITFGPLAGISGFLENGDS